ncbi:MAG: hypothetical protein ACFFA3_06725 [Promethearchaeota archaeon]
MEIKIKGARENNLKNIDVILQDGLTVVSGISGSGKSSLVYNTLYHEARRRFIEIFTPRSSRLRMPKAKVESITGVSPAIAIDQNVLNRNPFSTLATASGLHPFLRILFSNFGERFCPKCGTGLIQFSEDAIIERLQQELKSHSLEIFVPIVRFAIGSHKTLISMLRERFDDEAIYIDGSSCIIDPPHLDPSKTHTVEIKLADLNRNVKVTEIRNLIQQIFELGSSLVIGRHKDQELVLNKSQTCSVCDYNFIELEPKYFHQQCEYCKGKGCEKCQGTGIHPEAAAVKWQGKNLPELLRLSVDDFASVINGTFFPKTAKRLKEEIAKRIRALQRVGLGYISLDRSSPTLSRGESQRVRLAVILASRLEDMLHVLDEPTIGLAASDIIQFLPAFRDLAGPVVYVEHDRMAAAIADNSIDIGPGAGKKGGEIVFTGPPRELWQQDTKTGRYFSFREKVHIPKMRPPPRQFLEIEGVHLRNLKNIDIKIPLERLTVVSGVSGSGKSTFVKDVLVASLTKKENIGCKGIRGSPIKPVLVDQSPIGKNPRSNPATYTKLSDIVRNLFAKASGLSISHFSFNRKEGQCPKCKGIGAEEIKLPYIAPIWLPCEMCNGKRFNEEVMQVKVEFNGQKASIGDFYELSIEEATPFILNSTFLSDSELNSAKSILDAMIDIGLGYLHIGQPSPSLSGGEAQRVKLAKYLGKKDLSKHLIVLDEPSTGLSPFDLSGLLTILDRLVRVGATIVIVEHNTDIIRAADWIIDLGPGAGPKGGKLIHMGDYKSLIENSESLTAKALIDEKASIPEYFVINKKLSNPEQISIKGARANNLKNVSVTIPKGKLTVVTGVSGSGKSSLVSDVLELEARRRFLESLSMYERQSINEGPEAPVDSISGLGVTAVTRAGGSYYSWRIDPRYIVGNAADLLNNLFSIVATLGKIECPNCEKLMVNKKDGWSCPECDRHLGIITPEMLSPMNLATCCPKCKGLGFFGKPNPEKLIIHPDKPICGGAMYSPGFWPFGYYCKKYNHPYYTLRAMSKHFGYDPEKTPWNEMSEEAQQAFLFGCDILFEHEYETRTVKKGIRKSKWTGPFHEWGGFSWWSFGDLFETYSDKFTCPECNGQRLRSDYLSLRLKGKNIHELRQMTLQNLSALLKMINVEDFSPFPLKKQYWERLIKRLENIQKVGLGYLNIDRPVYTLSAGEYERLRIASTLGSGLTSITLLLDEPSRGLHSSEVNNLSEVLKKLCEEGNTVIVVEHDQEIIKKADHIIDMGPGAGTFGGEVIAQGTLDEILKKDTITSQWLSGKRKTISTNQVERIQPKKWMRIKGARENNLKNVDVRIPLGVLVGVLGLSGSGKSSLVIDTLGIALSSKKFTTSLASEQIKPGDHDSIEGAPKKVLLVDQSKKKIYSPMRYFGLYNKIVKIFAESEDADVLGLTEATFKKRCTVCKGRGRIQMDMGFLPTTFSDCDICKGTGYAPELWDVKVNGYSLPELGKLTINEVYSLFKEESEYINRYLKAAIDVGLGYLVLQQPGYTLSGGEAQRMKIANELCKKTKSNSLYILDEPSYGQHLEDVERLIGILKRLVKEGNSVIVVEHHPNILAACDWLIELGPVGGPDGGEVIASGTPETIMEKNTPSTPYLKRILEGTS